MTAEQDRLDAHAQGKANWRRWGPYVSERQWGTVREDYSSGGSAWDYLPHDHARSRTYRWGEDGIAGFGDEKLHWCLSLALWNGQDQILKERLFGLSNSEGNHGEDVKELYYYLDGTPTHSYMRMLYKYPHGAFPYNDLVAENRRRDTGAPEYEVIDTGVFADGAYFDVTVEYAKADTDDILMQVTIENRATQPAPLCVLPHLWARNTWSWRHDAERPLLMALPDGSIMAHHPQVQPLRLSIDRSDELLFCENETNTRRLFGADAGGFFKDGINDYVVSGDRAAVNPKRQGTKCAALTRLVVPACAVVQLRLRLRPEGRVNNAFKDFARIIAKRKAEADEFYENLQSGIADRDSKLVQRQALAGLLWSKQFYHFDVRQWLASDPAQPSPPTERKHGRNCEWTHLNNADIVSMPDKWEYPWYAAWDLAFHCVTFALVDPEFAKHQLILLTREWYMHPSGQLPAYEWAFGDVNPPVHAWATWRVYQMDKDRTGIGDRAFLERVFHKLMLNFTWWVNRKDAGGRNIFQGGFLGLDNIGLFDRSAPLPTGGCINQSDGTAWMAMYSLNLMRIAIELALDDHVYEDIATKFFEHFLGIAEAMTNIGGDRMGLWDEQDEFFYDVLKLPDGASVPLRVRSMVGLIPIYAVEVIDSSIFEKLPGFTKRLHWFLDYRPDLAALVSRWNEPGMRERRLLSLLRGHRLVALLRRMLDETEFLSEYGIRAVSKYHEAHPLEFEHNGQRFSVSYVPGESTSGLFGGNSNWRGPIWMPVNYLLIESLRSFHRFYGDDFRIEHPVGSSVFLHLGEIADELAMRLKRLFLRGADGRRPVLGDNRLIQEDPAFRDHVLFYEYFHGDTGRGVGASHQTGWTSLIALLLQSHSSASDTATLPVVGETRDV